MLRPPVAAVLHFPSNLFFCMRTERFLILHLLVLLLGFPLLLSAAEQRTQPVAEPITLPVAAPGLLAKIEKNSPDELLQILKRAELYYHQHSMKNNVMPITFVLHGNEVGFFYKQNYRRHQALVDLAAKLTAFKVVDIRICKLQSGLMGLNPQTLVPFVTPVANGVAEERRLVKERYHYF